MRFGSMLRRVLPVLGLVAVAGTLGLGDGTRTEAQATPPFRLFGNVMIDGNPAPPGTLIEAVVNGASCGSDRLTGNMFIIDVLSAAAKDWCANDRSQINFKIGGVPARESREYVIGGFLRQDLTRGPLPLFDTKLEPSKVMMASPDAPAKLAVFGEDETKAITVKSKFAQVAVLAIAYAPAPAGTSVVYVVSPTGTAITSAPESAELCTGVHNFPHIVACTVEAGASVTVQGALD
jgi:hypothetical protein